MPKITVQYSNNSQLIIDGSGNPGKDGNDGSHGSGVYNQRGEDGWGGENARDITLSLSSNEEKNIIEINVLNVGSYTLPLHDLSLLKLRHWLGGRAWF